MKLARELRDQTSDYISQDARLNWVESGISSLMS